MEISWIQGFKYIGLLFTIGTTFVGTWFFDFTTTERETGRKKFTKWGKRGFIFAITAIAATLGATIWSDYDAAKNQMQAAELQKAATQKFEEERASNLKFQDISRKSAADIVALLETIRSASLYSNNKETITSAAVNLSGIEDYKKYYPDLYARMVKATTFNELKDATIEGLTRAVNSRISDRPQCAGVPRASKDSMSGFPGEVFTLGENAALSYLITSDEVKLTLEDASELNNLNNSGYLFIFTDGSRIEMNCTKNRPTKNNAISMSCEDSTSNSRVRQAFLQLQQKMVTAVKTSKKKYSLSADIAKKIHDELSCISP